MQFSPSITKILLQQFLCDWEQSYHSCHSFPPWIILWSEFFVYFCGTTLTCGGGTVIGAGMGTGIGTGKALGIGDTGSLCAASAPPFWATSFSDFLGIPFHSVQNKKPKDMDQRSSATWNMLSHIYKNDLIKNTQVISSTELQSIYTISDNKNSKFI